MIGECGIALRHNAQDHVKHGLQRGSVGIVPQHHLLLLLVWLVSRSGDTEGEIGCFNLRVGAGGRRARTGGGAPRAAHVAGRGARQLRLTCQQLHLLAYGGNQQGKLSSGVAVDADVHRRA